MNTRSRTVTMGILVVRVKDKLDERAISRAFEHSDLAEACGRAEADGALECDDRGTDAGRSEALDSKWGRVRNQRRSEPCA